MTIRYLISFAAFPDFEKKNGEIASSQKEASYEVCTLKGVPKAVAMATAAHYSKNESWQIFDASAQPLEGDSPNGHDLVDRMEW